METPGSRSAMPSGAENTPGKEEAEHRHHDKAGDQQRADPGQAADRVDKRGQGQDGQPDDERRRDDAEHQAIDQPLEAVDQWFKRCGMHPDFQCAALHISEDTAQLLRQFQAQLGSISAHLADVWQPEEGVVLLHEQPLGIGRQQPGQVEGRIELRSQSLDHHHGLAEQRQFGRQTQVVLPDDRKEIAQEWARRELTQRPIVIFPQHTLHIAAQLRAVDTLPRDAEAQERIDEPLALLARDGQQYRGQPGR